MRGPLGTGNKRLWEHLAYLDNSRFVIWVLDFNKGRGKGRLCTHEQGHMVKGHRVTGGLVAVMA